MTNDSNRGQSPGGSLIRRRLLELIGGLGIVTFFGSLLTPLKDLSIASGVSNAAIKGRQLVVAAETFRPAGGSEAYTRGDPVTADVFSQPPDSVLAAPEDLLGESQYLIRLYYLEPERISEPTRLDWTDGGFVAYSAVCTHLGCTVGWETSDDEPQNAPAEKRIGASGLCPCHQTSFNPYQGAMVVSGPATRPVPQIGVEVDQDGAIRLKTGFEAEIGGE